MLFEIHCISRWLPKNACLTTIKYGQSLHGRANVMYVIEQKALQQIQKVFFKLSGISQSRLSEGTSTL